MSSSMTHTLTQKGQVTIPKAVRDFLGLRPGQEVSFSIDGNVAIVKKGEQSSKKMETWIGFGKGKLSNFKNIDDYLLKTRGRK